MPEHESPSERGLLRVRLNTIKQALQTYSGVVRIEDTGKLREIKNMEEEKRDIEERLERIESCLRQETERMKQETESTGDVGNASCSGGEVDDRSGSQEKPKS
jgi:chromatin segregation and condensation protein Rec8/ScpA/Scc1 (kleisin family)